MALLAMAARRGAARLVLRQAQRGLSDLIPPLPLATMPPVIDNPPARAVLGIIQIPTDYVMEKEGASIVELFPGVEMSLQKMVFANEGIDADTFQQAAENITAAAATCDF